MELIKQVLADGQTRFAAGAGEFLFKRLRPGALLVTISGQDTGQFGPAVLDEIRMEAMRCGALELLIDAEQAVLVSMEVSRDWTHFFSHNRERLKRVSVLTGSKLINLTVAIAQHLSQTGNLIQIYSDRSVFDEAVARAST
ncbi:MAG: hypothetical protein V4723_10600 [Pseudomonadota bacterium]